LEEVSNSAVAFCYYLHNLIAEVQVRQGPTSSSISTDITDVKETVHSHGLFLQVSGMKFAHHCTAASITTQHQPQQQEVAFSLGPNIRQQVCNGFVHRRLGVDIIQNR
jgi:hypothetical protein